MSKIIYGGVSKIGEVWILTLPTFHWVMTRSEVDRKRSDHICTKVRGTYMLVYGGVPDTGCNDNAGVQVMDLTTLEWTREIGPSGGMKDIGSQKLFITLLVGDKLTFIVS